MKAKGRFEVKNWDEKTWDGKLWSEVPGKKLTEATVNKVFEGDIEGYGLLKQLSAYNDDGSATFWGVEQITGSINSKKGSFIAHSNGVYNQETGEVQIKWSVVPGSATDELKGLCGEGSYIAKHSEYPYVSIELDYSFEQEFAESTN